MQSDERSTCHTAKIVWSAESCSPASTGRTWLAIADGQHCDTPDGCIPIDADRIAGSALAAGDTVLVAVSETETSGPWQLAQSQFESIHRIIAALLATGTPLKLLLFSGIANADAAAAHGLLQSLRCETEQLAHTWLESDASLAQSLTICGLMQQEGLRRLRVEGGKRLVAHLHQQVTPLANEPRSQDGPALIIGGLGGIGQHLLEHIVGQQPVFVMGRSPLSDERRSRLKALGCSGYFQGDATDTESLRQTLSTLHERYGWVDTVFHLAGHLEDGLFQSQTTPSLEKVMKTKIAPALALAHLQNEMAIRRVVMFGSLSATVGLAGQTAYASANAYLHALAERQCLQGHTGWSTIGWGIWDVSGMAMGQDRGLLLPMAPDKALAAMDELLAARCADALIYAGRLLTEAASGRQAAKASRAPTLDTKLLVRQAIAKFTGLENLAEAENVLDHGADSVAAISIAAEIERRLAEAGMVTRVPRSILFEYPSISSLSAYIEARAATIGLQPEPAVAPQSPPELTWRAPSPHVRAHTQDEPHWRAQDIAIVGMAGSFPGATSMEELWPLLAEARLAVRPVPSERWDWRAFYDSDASAAGRSYARHGGFIDNVEMFDPLFFQTTFKAAERMDPAERKLLQTTHHALENSGFFAAPTPDVGVFIAAMYGHYQQLEASQPIDTSFSAQANRLSYHFDFRGPSLTLDTMCSGSLTALHLAIAALRRGECRQAIVGAANIMVSPHKYRVLSQGKFLSPTGRCHTFGAQADGYVPGEGHVVFVLQPLQEAIDADARIHAVIHGSAVNAGGRSSGFTVPSAAAQTKVIEAALRDADRQAHDITYIEAHGTGTRLGDPIEIEALNGIYGARDYGHCAVGSIKSNIGHLEPAAGLAGLAKIVLQLRHRSLAPTIGCDIANPLIPVGEGTVRPQTELVPWNTPDGQRRYAGLSSFGAGGANAHVIVGEYMPPQVNAPARHDAVPMAVAISAQSEASLNALKAAILDYLLKQEGLCLEDVAYTLNVTRPAMRYRFCALVTDLDDLANALASSTAHQATFSAQLEQAASRFQAGESIDWRHHNPPGKMLDLPSYPFEKIPLWANELRVSHEPQSLNPPPETDDRLLLAVADFTSNASETTRTFTSPFTLIVDPELDRQLRGHGHRIVVLHPVDPAPTSSCGAPRTTNLVQACKRALDDIPQEHPIVIALGNTSSTPIAQEPTQRALHWALFQAIAHLQGPRSLMVCLPNEPDAQAGLVGLLRSLCKEQPQLRILSLQLGGSLAHPNVLQQALARLAFIPVSGHVHERLQGTQSQRLQWRPIELPVAPPTLWRQGGHYLIAGGFGGIGQAVARRLASDFGAHISLVGRRPDSAHIRHECQQMSAQGGTVRYYSADLADVGAAKALLAQMSPLNGVLIASGVLRDGVLTDKAFEDFEQVARSKIETTLALDEAIGSAPLDLFMLFSSIAAAFGNAGQTDYAYANAWLDGFAQARSRAVALGQRHGRTLSVAWPLWKDTGMQVDTQTLQFMTHETGLEPLEANTGVDLVLRLPSALAADVWAVAVLGGDTGRITERLLAPPRQDPAGNRACESNSPDALREAVNELLETLTAIPAQRIDPEARWGEMGLDSVGLQELAKNVQARFSVPMAASALFRYNTPSQLVHYLDSQRASDTQDLSTSRAPDAGHPDESLTGYAIIGMAATLPGGDTVETFWDSLLHGRSAIVPMTRWPEEDLYGGAVRNIEHFDARFFGLSAREAMLMDPQHRLFLQTAYNACLDAGYRPGDITRTGVFAGVQFNDYQVLLQLWGRSKHPFAATGNAHAMLSNRVSYQFGFSGPSETVDTACSSTLVALHRGIKALQEQECNTVLCGGVSLMIDPVVTHAAASMGVLSASARCATFDESADGYVRGEGCGAFLIKRYADAVRDGDNIRARIVASQVNHGGRANSLTSPNPNAQCDLLLAAYTPELAERLGYIEAHGTGTRLGDPIELQALSAFIAQQAPAKPPASVLVGAVKTNTGHLEPAAAVPALVKVIKAIETGWLPANLNFRQQNREIDLQDTPFSLLTEKQPWRSNDRVAGISSFGFGGTNAHVVLTQADAPTQQVTAQPGQLHLVGLCARTKESLERMRDELIEHLRSNPHLPLADVARTLAIGRESFEHRLVVSAMDLPSLIEQLSSAALHYVEPQALRSHVNEGPLLELDNSVVTELASAYLQGRDTLRRIYLKGPGRRISLPGYAFDSKPYWFETAADLEAS
ncbi:MULTISPECIES: SDR family NAD(P)-dependent oxidoreductase [unclassified Pseudomonas syringae group]|uniref:SDR family NAD(P)-dependent oxidoreductase n=1 Tax=unclassified Pseudomonas syringae group TaxID=2775504 RepID=UPI0029139209|nr:MULTISPECIES: SDR family NAD(P)-dependent oxidoreductase [unclassified Pseudomonas syringae group]MDU8606104.1 SDR family NAD(P)-dependent oxidoreductase [Pseudomonas syringae group sp. 247E2]MDU8629184.1 SDR family NAD(P)-dependent oxidoreductase [Pseudomonas syringae group sp. 243L2]